MKNTAAQHRIAVFGSSLPKPGEPDYTHAQHLGQALAQAGYIVMTGGYSGTMEAVSRGAAEAGGHVIGVTCADLETWRPLPPNQWVLEEIRMQTLRDRMYKLIDDCDAAIALPGGIGTLAEVAAMWSELQTSGSHPRLLVLVGAGWKGTFTTLLNHQGDYIAPPYRRLVAMADDASDAVAQLKQHFRL
jgi:uncharacterized protein (TIGR00730 family)